MFRRENTTPKTSLASSSKGNAPDVAGAAGAAVTAAVWRSGGGGVCAPVASPTTTADPDESVFRGLLYVDAGSAATGVAAIARETAGSSPLSVAGRGRFVRCQSW
jgi:hypothetical protein